jgi:GH25 family lysozyme M1 (1,4-beta-N-acetylmuramidase)
LQETDNSLFFSLPLPTMTKIQVNYFATATHFRQDKLFPLKINGIEIERQQRPDSVEKKKQSRDVEK